MVILRLVYTAAVDQLIGFGGLEARKRSVGVGLTPESPACYHAAAWVL
ncbi:MAG: hypothetical protein AAF552_16095 [Pseudomonadota bacterium]